MYPSGSLSWVTQAFKVLCKGSRVISRPKVVKFYQDALKTTNDEDFEKAISSLISGVVTNLRSELKV